MDDSILGHRSHVATTEDIDDRAAQEFEIGLTQIGLVDV